MGIDNKYKDWMLILAKEEVAVDAGVTTVIGRLLS